MRFTFNRPEKEKQSTFKETNKQKEIITMRQEINEVEYSKTG